jgi:hypothetical protein
MRQTLLAGIVALLSTTPSAQLKPDFSGSWTYTADRTAAGSSARPNFGTQFVARQTAEALTIERTTNQATTTEEYKFDGSESRMKRPNGETIYRTTWDSGRLVIQVRNTALADGGGTVATESRRMLWLESPDTLVVENVITAPVHRPAWTSVYKKMATEQTAAAAQVAQLKPTQATLADVTWIAGAWAGGSATVTLEEHWTPAAGGAMLGVSRTVKDNRMVAFEFLRIVERAGGLVYIAQPNGVPPTEFTLTALDAESATFENPAHDYPKVIRYAKRPDGSLEARISAEGGRRPQTFLFKRR